MFRNTHISAEDLRGLLDYDPGSGLFTWRTPLRNSTFAGKIAGRQMHDGYRRIKIKGIAYSAHRLAWLYMTGVWPTADIDHKDGMRSNNAFANLREANASENAQNLGIVRKNRSGLLGVTFHKKVGKWQAQIKIGGKPIYLGLSETAEEASAKYLAAKAQLHTFSPSPRGVV